MRQGRGLLIGAVWLGSVALLGGTLAHGLYHRSDRYRRSCESRLTEFFGLPVDIARIHPHTFRSRELDGIRIWLPEKRDQFFQTPHAVWDAGDDETHGAALHVYDAQLRIDSLLWKRDDYTRVLRASLAHNFSDLDLRRVEFHNARLEWFRQDVHVDAGRVEGHVVFDETGQGTAEFRAGSLNGFDVAEPVRILARIEPDRDEFLPEVKLIVPQLPLPALRLSDIVGGPLTQGSFAGEVIIRPSSSGDDTVELQGQALALRLDQLTRRLPGGPVSGVIDLRIHSAHLREKMVDEMHLTGRAHDLAMDTLLPRFNLPAIGGTLKLVIHEARLAANKVADLHASGDWHGGSLDTLTRAILKRGGVQGRVQVRVNVLHIVDNELERADVDLIALPLEGQRGAISYDFLKDLLNRQLHMGLPDQPIPGEVEFTQIGAHLTIEGTKLRVRPLDGPAGPALVTLRLFNREIPLLANVDQTYDLAPLREKLHEPLEELRNRIRERLGAPATRPAATTRGADPQAGSHRTTRTAP